MSEEKLTRSETDKIIAGVCGGTATYIGIDPVIVRFLFLVLAFASGIGLVLYAILWFIMPLENIEDSIRMEGDPPLAENGEERQATQMQTIGVVLLMFGGFFLLQQIGFFTWISAGIFWPIVLIGGGVYLLVVRKKKQKETD